MRIPPTTQDRRIHPTLVHRTGKIVLVTCTLLSLLRVAAEPPQAPADVVIRNAKIWSGLPAGSQDSTALAIRGEKIVAIGKDSVVRAWIGSTTRTIDAQGRRVIPGITDSHTHIVSGGFQLDRLNLRDVDNRAAFIQRVKEAASGKNTGEWVLGGRWSVESWSSPQPPNKAWLDPVTRHVPVFLTRMDGHQALVNSEALHLAGIREDGPADPVGGQIERDPETGAPTGILKDAAMGLVRRHIPDSTDYARYEALLRAMKHANSLGVTSVHDMSNPGDLAAFRRAYNEGNLTVRITSYVQSDDWPSLLKTVTTFQPRDDLLRVAGFKGYMDGSMGSRTAYMREPYADATEDSKYPRGQLTAFASDREAFHNTITMATARGLQVAVHAIGDEAIHLLLDAYADAAERTGRRNAHHRVEHAQHLLTEDLPRFAKLGVVASMQPFHKADDGRYAESVVGRERLKGSYAYRQLVDTGALVCFGSDWPVVTLNPFAGIDSAVNARTLAGEVWLPSHSLTLDEALRACTIWPARVIGRDDRLGTLEPGKLADVLILADDPLTMPRDKIGQVKVDMTIVGGKVVYERG